MFLQLGTGKFVKGLDEGILSMEIGEKATFIIPPQLGFGKKQMGKILPNSTLCYDIELVESFDPFLNVALSKNKINSDSTFIYVYSANSNSINITTESIVNFNYKAYFLRKDGVKVMFENNFYNDNPIIQRPGSGNGFPGIEKALLYLKKNDTATVQITHNRILNKKKLIFLPEGADIFFDIYIKDVTSYPFININSKDTIVSATGLKFIQVDLAPNVTNKDTVKNGYNLNVGYTIYFNDSLGNRKILDCTRDSGKPLNVVVGNGKNIKGFEEGLIGMTPTTTRRLLIPALLAYGKNGLIQKGVPPNADLIMDIEYIEILNK